MLGRDAGRLPGTGFIYVYALSHTSSAFVRVASIQSGFTGVMGLEFDRDVGYLWVAVNDTGGSQAKPPSSAKQ